jgi:hypothetical protein
VVLAVALGRLRKDAGDACKLDTGSVRRSVEEPPRLGRRRIQQTWAMRTGGWSIGALVADKGIGIPR